MTNRNFTLIKGGLSEAPESDKKSFVSAFITNTRLMGVVGLYMHWKVEEDGMISDFHQFYYFDAEEYGFQTYWSVSGNDVEEINYMEQALMGGLGGQKVDVTEKEATFLLQFYADMNRKLSIEFPEVRKEYDFLLERDVKLTGKEQQKLFKKQCVPVASDYSAINYFLMRCFGKDYEGAKFLASGDFPLNIYDDISIATLCKNTIDAFEGEDSSSYMCESLIEHDSSYMLIVSEVTVSKSKITSFEKRSVMNVSAIEAAMMLSRPEFITVYEILISPDDFDDFFDDFVIDTLPTIHENGRLFMAFNKNNDHVNKQTYNLNEDVFGLYYVTNFGQLIISAYSVAGIRTMERKLRKVSPQNALLTASKYEFKEPVLFEFIQSDFDDFDDFIDFIKG